MFLWHERHSITKPAMAPLLSDLIARAAAPFYPAIVRGALAIAPTVKKSGD
jgi:hypothetical protein